MTRELPRKLTSEDKISTVFIDAFMTCWIIYSMNSFIPVHNYVKHSLYL